ncbi:hypothetical protein BJX99DRAFT_43874 [Aspergillus californicus]
MDCQINGVDCAHCRAHGLQLYLNGAPTDGLWCTRPTHPVVFKCQFIYRYDEDAYEFAKKLQDRVAADLARRYKTTVQVYSDFRSHQHVPGDDPSLWISLLVDFPRHVKLTKKLKRYLFDGLTPSLNDWKAIPAKQLDHLNLERLEWFMERAGIPHMEGCYDMYGDYL